MNTVINRKVSVSPVVLFIVRKIAERIARIQVIVGKYCGLENISFSFFVMIDKIIPVGIARIRLMYSIICLLGYVCF